MKSEAIVSLFLLDKKIVLGKLYFLRVVFGRQARSDCKRQDPFPLKAVKSGFSVLSLPQCTYS